VVDLGAGEPDFPTPAHIAEAGRRAIVEGHTRYTAVEGIAPLRSAIAELASVTHERPVAAEEVIVTTGTKQALFNACFTLFGPGDEVLVPTPAWTSYYEMIGLAGATPVEVWGSDRRTLNVTADDLRARATARTRGVILNSPCNPTGAVYGRQELASILATASAEGWWVISDEIYRAIAYGDAAPSALEVTDDRSRLIVVDGVAKSYAMTGWRIGWSIAPRAVSRAMAALQSHTTSNAATPSQHAALAALTEREASDRAVSAMVAAFRERRDAALPVLRSAGVEVVQPDGAFYLFLRVGNATADDPDPATRFATALLDEEGIAVVPGAAFRAPEWIRVSYAAPVDQVMRGVRAIASRL
jgi:aspartate aminotransferase